MLDKKLMESAWQEIESIRTELLTVMVKSPYTYFRVT